jgi:protoporphyrinogen oxidase
VAWSLPSGWTLYDRCRSRRAADAEAGGDVDPSAIDRSDAAIVDDVTRDLTRVLTIAGSPDLVRVYRWRNATPQIEVGHGTLIGRIEIRLAALPGVFLSALGFRGSGIADCVADARVQASAAAALLRPALTA